MKRLNSALLDESTKFPKSVKVPVKRGLPEKVLQFGEGNFLRGFADWMFNRMNERGLFNGKVVIIQPISEGHIDILNEQNGLYTLFLTGLQNEAIVKSREIITSVSRGINPFTDFEDFIKCSENTDLRVIISNTTEAGIVYNPDDKFRDTPPSSFPGKLTVFLYKRFKIFSGDPLKGFIIIPCELIDRNGDNLKKIVLRLAVEWKLGDEFLFWVEHSNYFLNTLVDRIVTGYPIDKAEEYAAELGYEDKLLDTGEIYHLWVIEGDRSLASELPFEEAGLNVLWTEDITPYRTRKVRMLNGTHTITVPAAFLLGKDTVKECVDDKVISAYFRKGLFEEIIPTIDLPEKELLNYANAVLERFANPFIRHYLLSISLNSISKFKTRVLPSILEYKKRKGKLPEILSFSLSALLAFYKGTEIHGTSLMGDRGEMGYEIKDDMKVLETFKDLWARFDGTKEGIEYFVSTVLGKKYLWGEDLNLIEGFTTIVTEHLYNIINDGIENVINKVIGSNSRVHDDITN